MTWERIRDFREIEDEFLARAHRMVWCSLATVDEHGRPLSRIVHTIWEMSPEGAPVGWIGTRRTSPKARDIEARPWVSCGYVSEVATPLYAECRATFEDSAAAKQHLWDLFANAPEPLGFDPAPIFKSVDHADFGVIRLEPWRVQLMDPPSKRRTWLAGSR